MPNLIYYPVENFGTHPLDGDEEEETKFEENEVEEEEEKDIELPPKR